MLQWLCWCSSYRCGVRRTGVAFVARVWRSSHGCGVRRVGVAFVVRVWCSSVRVALVCGSGIPSVWVWHSSVQVWHPSCWYSSWAVLVFFVRLRCGYGVRHVGVAFVVGCAGVCRALSLCWCDVHCAGVRCPPDVVVIFLYCCGSYHSSITVK
jgi:hypothetical protein